MQNQLIRIRKSYLFGLLALLLMAPLPWLYFNPPQFLQGQPLAVYAIVLFLSGMSSAALAIFFFLKPRLSPTAARTASLLFLLTGISAYQFSGLAPNWNCFGKQIYVATANAAGQNCTTTCTDNDVKPCSGWSTCWDKFVSCNGAGKDQDGRNCAGCCFSCTVVCEQEPDNPPSIAGTVTCSQVGENGWCRGTGLLTLTASDPQGYALTIFGDIAGAPFTCPPGSTCFQPLPQGNGMINYTVTAPESGMDANGSTTWKLDATPPAINGTLSSVAGTNGWHISPVSYNGAASDSLSGLAGFTCTLDGSPLGSCNTVTVTGEGLHTLLLTAKDQAGNAQTSTQNISIDTQNPSLTSSISGTLGSNNWYTNATLTASASDPSPGSGLWALEYNLDNTAWAAFPAPGALTLPEGQHTIEIRAVDNAGRIVSAAKSYSLDATLPAVTLSPSGTLGSNNWYTTRLILAASASDSPSGMDVFEYSLNNGAWTNYSAPLTLGDGTHKVSFWAQDKAGLVKQVDETYQVDTRPPQIAGSLSGAPGTNGWYISQVAISASAVDPTPGSALEALTYILNGGMETAYTGSIKLSDGVHTIQFDAQDFAGLTDTMMQTIKVDTIAPSLNILTTLPAWNKDTVTLSGTSGDGGSGLARVEISTDGGLTWRATTGTTSWTYNWDTTTSANGSHQVRVRVTDNAGLTTEHSLQAGVDNNPPKISLPNSWLQWDTVTLDVWDNDSGLAEVRVEIRDPEGRWQTRKIDLDPNSFPLNFKWDRRFGDDTVAPLGTYPVKVISYDNMGNMKQMDATIRILLGILPAGPAATPQPYVRVDTAPVPASTPAPFATPTVMPAPVISAFGSTPEAIELAQGQHDAQTEADPAIMATPRAAPTQTTFTGWLESIFAPEVTEETVTDVSTPETDSKIHWDATLAAMMAAAAAYALSEKRKQEEERLRGNHAHKRYLEKEEAKRNHEALMRDIAEFNAKKRTEEYIQDTRDARMEAKMAHVEYVEDAKWTVSQYVIQQRAEEKAKAEELQAGLAAYYSARKQGEEEASSKSDANVQENWWEKTKSFVSENIIQPVNTYVYQPVVKPLVDATKDTIVVLNESVYQPYIKPEIEWRVEAYKSGFAWVNENIYQSYIKPEIEWRVEAYKSGFAWVNENIYQSYIKPEIEWRVEVYKSGFAWVNENIYQPYIKPEIEWRVEAYKSGFAWVNENIYQPYIKPEIEWRVEAYKSGFAWVNENIYQPIFAPVVNDINKYIYQPLADTTEKFWGKYGEWVHNSLDAAGFIPGLGEIADGLNGLIFLAEGRYIEAVVSAAAMIPLIGDLGKAGKWTVKAGQEILEEAVEKVAKEAAEEVIEKAAKEAAEEVMEKAFKETATEFIGESAEKALKESSEELATKVVKNSTAEVIEETTEKVAKEAVDALSPKVIAESAENTAENAVQKTVGNILEKASKDTGEAISSASIEKASKEVKDKLVEQALEKVDDKTAALVRSVAENLGDDVHSINKAIALVQKHGDDAVSALKAVEPEASIKVLRTVDENVLDDVVQQGSDAFVAFSGWTEKELKEHGKDLAARAAKDAEVLKDVKTLVSKGPIDPKNLTDEQKFLIEKIAANSTFYIDGKKVVVGKWVGLDGGFLGRAKETGSLHYSPHPDLWALFGKLDNQNEAAWLINQKVIQNGVDKGLPFEYTLNGIPEKVLDNEHDAIEAIFSGNPSDNDILRLLKSDYIPVRIRELQELSQYGYKFNFDDSIQSYILSLKKGN